MLDSLRHRGPDGLSHWCEGSIALGQATLRATEEPHGDTLPFASAASGYVVAADARIDNRADLFDALGVERHRRAEMGDAELILAAYEAWGDLCAERLIGDFAFALWDARRRCLFCARDPLGVRAFYYHLRPAHLFVFGTEIKALLQHSAVPRRLNEAQVADYLAGVFDDREATFYRDIHRLAPGCSMTVDHSGSRTQVFWSLHKPFETPPSSDDEQVYAVRACFEEAVRCRIPSRSPVGSMLSGGLDSSSVSCVAERLRVERSVARVHTFSSIFRAEPECDESEYIEMILAAGDFHAHSVNVDKIGPLTDIETCLRVQDEPLIAPIMSLEWALYDVARLHGITTVLHGNGGDTVISHGEAQVAVLARNGNWLAALKGTSALAKNYNLTIGQALMRYLLGPLLPRVTSAVQSLYRKPVQSLLNPQFAERLGHTHRSAAKAPSFVTADPVRRQHLQGLSHGALPALLESRDRTAAAHGVDPCYPFYDRRLVELSASLAGNQKLHDGWTRIVMRRAMDGILPPNIQWRKHKTEMLAHLASALVRVDGERLAAIVHQPTSRIDEFADRIAVQRAHRRLRSSAAANLTPRRWADAQDLWRTAVLSMWLDSVKPER